VEDIVDWHQYQKELLEDWGLDKIIKPGYRALFYGAFWYWQNPHRYAY
jgi:hypothetical protein